MPKNLHAQFYKVYPGGFIREALGTDQIHHIDGRYGLSRAIDDTTAHYTRLQSLQPDYAYFRIFIGPLQNRRPVSALIPIQHIDRTSKVALLKPIS